MTPEQAFTELMVAVQVQPLDVQRVRNAALLYAITELGWAEIDDRGLQNSYIKYRKQILAERIQK